MDKKKFEIDPKRRFSSRVDNYGKFRLIRFDYETEVYYGRFYD